MGNKLLDVESIDKKRKINEILPNWIAKFFYSEIYLFLLLFIAAMSHIFKLPALGIGFFAFFATIILVVLDDVLPTLPLIFFGVLLIPKTDDITQLFSLAYGFIPVVLAIIFHLIYYRRKLKLGKMFFPQLAISIAMLLGGVGVIPVDRYVGALGYTLLLGPMILLLYFLFTNFMHKNKYIEMGDYIAKMLVLLGTFSVIQVIVFYSNLDVPPTSWGSIRVELGWGIANNIATLLCFTGPMSFYFIAKGEKVVLNIVLGAFQYLGLLLTFSRGGILFGFLVLFVVIVVTFIQTKERTKLTIALVIALIVAGILYGIFFDSINSVFKALRNRGFGLSNRDLLYAEAWGMFVRYPLLGVGMGFAGEHFTPNEIPFYWFHSTLFQILGSTGLVGVGAFIYFYIVRYKILLFRIKKHLFKQFLFLSFLGFELYSMMDAGTFIPMPFMLLAMILTCVAEKENVDLEQKYPKIEKRYEPIIIKSSTQPPNEEKSTELQN